MQRLDVDEMLEELPAPAVLRWLDFLAVRHERDAEARAKAAEAADGYDDEEIHW